MKSSCNCPIAFYVSGKKPISQMFANALLTERNSFPIRYITVNNSPFAMKVKQNS